jgi:hypothetical protein
MSIAPNGLPGLFATNIRPHYLVLLLIQYPISRIIFKSMLLFDTRADTCIPFSSFSLFPDTLVCFYIAYVNSDGGGWRRYTTVTDPGIWPLPL